LGLESAQKEDFKHLKDSEESSVGVGLLFDTNVAGDRFFNYRLNFGYSRIFTHFNNENELNRISAINTFGFGVVRTGLVRFWLGPQVGVHFNFGEISTKFIKNDIAHALYAVNGISNAFTSKDNFKIGKIDAGLAIGVNLNLANNITIGLDGGIRYGLVVGSVDSRIRGMYTNFPSLGNPPIVKKTKYNSIGSGWEIYGAFSVIYRINDSFSSV
jgi:hypothetical protein